MKAKSVERDDFLNLMYGQVLPEADAMDDAASDIVEVKVGAISYKLPSLSYVSRLETKVRVNESDAAQRDPKNRDDLRHAALLSERLDEASRKIRALETLVKQTRALLNEQARTIKNLTAELATKIGKSL